MSKPKGPSEHLSWDELSNWNRLGRTWNGVVPGALVAVYPLEWRSGTALQLAVTFEDIRHHLGDEPMFINSAYRCTAYNRAVNGAQFSQHCLGRAIDFRHRRVKPRDVYHEIRDLYADGLLPFLGGVGLYSSFVHIDVRPRLTGRLAVWTGSLEGA